MEPSLIQPGDWEEMNRTRNVLHNAVQLAAMFSRGIFPPDPEDSQSNLGWDSTRETLWGRPFGPSAVQSGIQFPKFSFYLARDGQTMAELALVGQSPISAFQWICERAEKLGLPTDRLSLAAPYDIPGRMDDQALFLSPEPNALQQWAGYFTSAQSILDLVKRKHIGASEVRCWPHHFDTATLITRSDLVTTRTIGVGFSPGDSSPSIPYFYVTPWPYPPVSAEQMPQFSRAGEWNSEGWFGALLKLEDLVTMDSEKNPQVAILDFIEEAIKGIEELVDN